VLASVSAGSGMCVSPLCLEPIRLDAMAQVVNVG
jgi:hypothetical protein